MYDYPPTLAIWVIRIVWLLYRVYFVNENRKKMFVNKLFS